MSAPDLRRLPGLILDGEEPVFDEPWQAQAFAMVVSLHDRKVFTWAEWAEALSQQLANAVSDDARQYYHHWLAALENLMAEKGVVTPQAIETRERQWHEAAARTPHGEPIELGK